MGKSSLYRGVTLFRPTGKWRAQVGAVVASACVPAAVSRGQSSCQLKAALVGPLPCPARTCTPATRAWQGHVVSVLCPCDRSPQAEKRRAWGTTTRRRRLLEPSTGPPSTSTAARPAPTSTSWTTPTRSQICRVSSRARRTAAARTLPLCYASCCMPAMSAAFRGRTSSGLGVVCLQPQHDVAYGLRIARTGRWQGTGLQHFSSC